MKREGEGGMKREGEGGMKGERQTAEHNSIQGKVCNVCI